MTAHETEIRGNTLPVTAPKPKVLQGYAIVWNSRSQPLGAQGVIERAAPSFANKQRGDNQFADVVVSYDHRNDFCLGRVGSNAVLDLDKTGARYTVNLLDTRSAEEVYAWVDSGVVRGSSFSFNVYEDDWDWQDGVTQRTLISGKINDIGPTPNPAYLSSTSIALRSLAFHRGVDPADVEALAAQGRLRKLWFRTDQQLEIVEARADMPQQETLSQQQVWLELERLKTYPEPRVTTEQAWLELQRLRYDPAQLEALERI